MTTDPSDAALSADADADAAPARDADPLIDAAPSRDVVPSRAAAPPLDVPGAVDVPVGIDSGPGAPTALLELHLLDLWSQPLPTADATLTVTRDGVTVPTLPGVQPWIRRVELGASARLTVTLDAPAHRTLRATSSSTERAPRRASRRASRRGSPGRDSRSPARPSTSTARRCQCTPWCWGCGTSGSRRRVAPRAMADVRNTWKTPGDGCEGVGVLRWENGDADGGPAAAAGPNGRHTVVSKRPGVTKGETLASVSRW